jgi:ariadne-1
MTCQRCKFEFCWIWRLARSRANTGATTSATNTIRRRRCRESEDQSDAAKAKRDLDRYLHYYKRFHAHQEAQMFAKRSLKETEARMVLLQESST